MLAAMEEEDHRAADREALRLHALRRAGSKLAGSSKLFKLHAEQEAAWELYQDHVVISQDKASAWSEVSGVSS